MPPQSVAFGDVQRRLRALQRRLNLFALLHAVCLGSSIIVLLVAALIVIELRIPTAMSRGLLGAAFIFTAAVAAVSVYAARRKWMDLSMAARVADQRGALDDRLATVVDLQDRRQSSVLAPLLVQQVLTRGAQWHASRIQPRALPHSVYVLGVALLAVVSTLFISPSEPPPKGAAPAVKPPKPSPPDAVRAPAPAPAIGSNQSPGYALLPPSNDPLEEVEGDFHGEQAGSAGEPGADPEAVSLASLPDRVQQAVREAFGAAPAPQPQQRPGSPQTQSADPSARDGGSGKGEEATKKPHSAVADDAPGGGSAKNSESGKQESGGEGGKAQKPEGSEQQPEGASPGRGDGTSPGGLLGADATGSPMDSGVPKTFKLTITSFLRGVERQSPSRKPTRERISTAGTGAPSSGSAASLNERQLNDDLLRKAEVPPEYEDIVRRVYSARAAQ